MPHYINRTLEIDPFSCQSNATSNKQRNKTLSCANQDAVLRSRTFIQEVETHYYVPTHNSFSPIIAHISHNNFLRLLADYFPLCTGLDQSECREARIDVPEHSTAMLALINSD